MNDLIILHIPHIKKYKKAKSKKFLKRKSKSIKGEKLNWGKVRSKIDCWGPKSPPTFKMEEVPEQREFIVRESPVKREYK